MAKGELVSELRAWRQHKGMTLEQASALIVVDGKRADRGMWHAWESGRKMPRGAWMFEIERVTGVQPNAFYRRPGSAPPSAMPPDPRQASMF